MIGRWRGTLALQADSGVQPQPWADSDPALNPGEEQVRRVGTERGEAKRAVGICAAPVLELLSRVDPLESP